MKKEYTKAKGHSQPKAESAADPIGLYKQGLIVGLLSLLWLFLKTGKKPSRIQYPCQQTAVANVTIFLIPALTLGGLRLIHWLRHRLNRTQLIRLLSAGLVSVALIAGVYSAWRTYTQAQLTAYYQGLRSQGPFGKKAPAALGAAAGSFLTLPHAMALPSAHRVVSVHDAEATSWTFACTSGSCDQYYGDDNYVDQQVVDQMVGTGLLALTEENNLTNAWRAILPNYQTGEVIAIKLNFNNSFQGYGDNDVILDALPQIVNSIVSGLTAMGVQQQHIWVFDVSRVITDRFRARIDFPGIRYFDYPGNGADVERATFDSTAPSAQLVWEDTAYSGGHQLADVLLEADYLINVPLMKTHGGTGVTLSLKNHLGSIDGFYTGSHAMHDYIYLTRSNYESSANATVEINLNANIVSKTILIIGDGLYGGLTNNYSPPERWRTFGNGSPNMLFFGADPVAIDSVMYDYLERETPIDPRAEDILLVAADKGLGVHERWNNDSDRQYTTIDYIEIEGAGSVQGSGNVSDGGSGGCFINEAL